MPRAPEKEVYLVFEKAAGRVVKMDFDLAHQRGSRTAPKRAFPKD